MTWIIDKLYFYWVDYILILLFVIYDFKRCTNYKIDISINDVAFILFIAFCIFISYQWFVNGRLVG